MRDHGAAMHAARTFLRVASFPALFAGTGAAAYAAYAAASASLLMPLLVGLVGAAVLALERTIPYEAEWNRGQERARDVLYLGLTSLAVSVAEASVWGLVALASARLAPDPSGWPAHWPFALQVLLAFALGDLLPYLYHRASHETSGWLWRVHAIHHAPERMYALGFARFHPVNAFLTAALTLAPLALLGAPPQLLFVAAVLHNVHGLMSHANVDFRLGPLNLVFSMAELHRLHHARDPRLANGNYGATVLLWDWLFGTRRTSAARIARDGIGLWAGSFSPRTVRGQLAYPFAPLARWTRLPRCCRAT